MSKENSTVSKMETPTLTEQWRNGTLPENWYYVHIKSDWGGIDYITINYFHFC